MFTDLHEESGQVSAQFHIRNTDAKRNLLKFINIRKTTKSVIMILSVSFRALIAGGGAPETELSINLAQYANTLSGMDSYCVRAFSEAMEVVPYTLAENAGLNPIATVTELRNKHAQGEKNAGINVRKVLHAVTLIVVRSACLREATNL